MQVNIDKHIHNSLVNHRALCVLGCSFILATRTERDQTALRRQIDATDRQIDALVYELYGLGEEEIGIVEAN